MNNRRMSRWAVSLATLVTAATLSSCVNNNLWLNNTADISGDVTFIINNDTPYIATFSMGTWNDLDRQIPRLVNFEQIRMTAGVTDPIVLACARNVAIGTQGFVDWVDKSDESDAADFEEVLLHAQVYFSDAAQGSDAADLPTIGTAEGLELLLGVHYSCDDLIIFTLVEDPDAQGGFRIDYTVVKDEDRDAE